MTTGVSLDSALRSVGPGWGGILRKLYAKLPKSVYVSQVKEKYGSLRFYIGSGSERTFKIIDAAEKESETTCEVCGEPGEIIGTGWLMCRCPKHASN
jgi:hypothetical protein